MSESGDTEPLGLDRLPGYVLSLLLVTAMWFGTELLSLKFVVLPVLAAMLAVMLRE